MIKFGIHPFVWTSKWEKDSTPLIRRARELGFGLLDIPVRALDAGDVQATRAALEEWGMSAVGVAGVGLPTDLTSEDASVRRQSMEYLKRVVRNTQAIGAEVLAGVFYAPIGRLVGRGPTEQELEQSAQGLKELARYAQDYDVRLALEAVNRYETYFINTCQQGLEMLERIDESNVGLLLDTYHMNIEEKGFYRPIVDAGERLFHIHLCENDRGVPGSGLVRWDDVFRALGDIRYEGAVSIESFTTSIPEIAAATCVWRSLAPDGDTLALEGLRYLRSMAECHGLLG